MRSRRPSTFSPWQTRARLTPVSGITSHTVASATRSSIPIRSGSGRCAKKPGAAQHAHRRDRGQEGHRRGAQQRQAGPVIEPVGIDRGQDRWRRAFRLVVIQHDHVGHARHRCQRRRRGRSAIDANDQRGAARRPARAARARSGRSPRSRGRARRGSRRSPAPAAGPPSARRRRRRPRRSRRTPPPSRRGAPRRPAASAATSMSISSDGSGSSARRVGSRKFGGALDADAACRQQPPDDVRHAQPLRDAEADAVLRFAPDPAASGQAARDLQAGCVMSGRIETIEP